MQGRLLVDHDASGRTCVAFAAKPTTDAVERRPSRHGLQLAFCFFYQLPLVDIHGFVVGAIAKVENVACHATQECHVTVAFALSIHQVLAHRLILQMRRRHREHDVLQLFVNCQNLLPVFRRNHQDFESVIK